MINNVTLIGNLGRDAEVLSAQGLTRYNVATRHSWKDKAGEWQDRTDWHRVTFWREKPLPKGALVYIEGRIQYHEHEGKRYTEIIANTVRQLDRATSAHMPSAPIDSLEEPVGSGPGDDGLPF